MYFSKKKWAELQEWEKVIYKNQKQNHEAMIAIGLNSPKPEFMRQPPRRKQTPVEDNGDSDPAHAKEGSVQGHTSSVYSNHKKQQVTYAEIDEPNDDDYFYCNICHSFFLDKCNIHGPPVFIKNPLVEIGVANRARLTLPQGMIIKVSKIPNAGLGVWNERRVIPNSIHFGPYEGELTSEKEAALSGYSWMIRKGNSDHEYLDAKNEANSNWMRYVNCARNDEEQNLVAFQYKGQIFYRSCKPIPPGCELLVWYGDEYGKELGVGLDFMWERSIEIIAAWPALLPKCPAPPLTGVPSASAIAGVPGADVSLASGVPSAIATASCMSEGASIFTAGLPCTAARDTIVSVAAASATTAGERSLGCRKGVKRAPLTEGPGPPRHKEDRRLHLRTARQPTHKDLEG
ncbi:putative histone-lysine N-methyltransferase PRDM7 [Acipenser ruthenus]|uniref:Putative histone-lysine N-methyltransferase PRDM7 n=1 Tax=Acipenser ruthenus TaxID=7906 RepID=A0A444UMN6_ACIRT|nr:putative histone-lysine N-methyltransferase PRDM7 [Acipenser ruthenus]